MGSCTFDWEAERDTANQKQHGVAFDDAQWAFFDSHRLLVEDTPLPGQLPRRFCLGKVGGLVLTVRYRHHEGRITLLSAGYWKKGRHFHETQNQFGG